MKKKKIKLSILGNGKKQVISISGEEVKPFNYQDYTVVVCEPTGPNNGMLIDAYDLDSPTMVFDLNSSPVPYIKIFVINNKKVPIEKVLLMDEDGVLTDDVYYESDWIEPVCAIYCDLPDTTSERTELSLGPDGTLYSYINNTVADKKFTLLLVLLGDPLGTKFYLNFI